MQSFEDVRSHVASRWSLRANEPYLISLDLKTTEGRKQGVYLAEINTDDGAPMLRISTPVAPMGSLDGQRCLRFNWEQRIGFLALSDLDGEPFLQLCENRRYVGLDEQEVDRVIHEMGVLADSLENSLLAGQDLT